VTGAGTETATEAGTSDGAAGSTGRRALVHVGLNKAGSSTIQAWLLLNRDRLAQRGVAYDRLEPPEGGGPGRLNMATGWHRLAEDLSRDGAPPRPEVAAFAARAEAAWGAPGLRQAVISSEYIAEFVTKPARLAAFTAWLGRRFDRVDYLLYLRDQTEWVASGYAQSVKTGGTRSLQAFVAHRGAQDHHALARRWHEAARAAPGEARLHVRLLEPDALRGGSLLRDFAHHLEVSLDGLADPGRRNESMSARRLRALCWANRAGDVLAGLGLPGAKARLARATERLDGGPPLRLDRPLAAQVAQLNAASNERLRAWLFPERPCLYPRSAALLAAHPASQHAPALA
jgi:hypothetical protein